MNYSICFSAKSDYFAETKALAEPAVRFYTKLYLQPFTLEETLEYADSALHLSPHASAAVAGWLHEKTLGHPYFLAFVCKHRSEEHTSELQSRLHLVCRLLLEKKKQNLTRTLAPVLSV